MMRSSTPYKLDWHNHPARGIAKDTVVVQYMNDSTEFNLALSMARQILDDMIGRTLIQTPVTCTAS
jgi:hypothetical protein